jgi:hypothetical protein
MKYYQHFNVVKSKFLNLQIQCIPRDKVRRGPIQKDFFLKIPQHMSIFSDKTFLEKSTKRKKRDRGGRLCC